MPLLRSLQKPCQQGIDRYMSDQTTIFIVENDDFVRKHAAFGLNMLGLLDCVQMVETAPDVADSAVITLQKPIRIGRIADQILHQLSYIDGSAQQNIAIGAHRLDVHQGLFYRNDEQGVRLTEKEVALLQILSEAAGDAVPRDMLLDRVWQYAEGVETHTLETHIYRLRQKIEKDPTAPELLQTNDDGYFLCLG